MDRAKIVASQDVLLKSIPEDKRGGLLALFEEFESLASEDFTSRDFDEATYRQRMDAAMNDIQNYCALHRLPIEKNRNLKSLAMLMSMVILAALALILYVQNHI